MMKKDTKDMEPIELAFADVMRTAERIQKKLEKIEALADDALIKASMSHSLVIVRKVSEDNLQKLNEILD